MEEINRLNRDFGVGAISFRDDLLTFNEDHTRELCDRIVSSGLKIPWKCQTRVDRVSAGLLRSMRRAGCTLVSFGVESGSEAIMKKMRKGITKAQVERAFAWCREAGMPSIAYFMIGTPWETPETIEETISFAKRLPSTGSTFFLATPYPGTELEEEFRRAGWPIPDDLDVYVHARALIHRADTGSGESDGLRSYFLSQCRRAAREVLLARLKDPLDYPRLLRAYLRRQSPAEFLGSAARVSWGLLAPPSAARR
jgi:radical SAM superfamily enzyme YgiQ (UPF0313 family)